MLIIFNNYFAMSAILLLLLGRQVVVNYSNNMEDEGATHAQKKIF